MQDNQSKNNKRIERIKIIENRLRNYKNYRAGIISMKRQLDHIMPDITASYEVQEGSTGTFNIKSDTENYAIDRIESKRALVIHEDLKYYQLVVQSIDDALAQLDELEKEFIRLRYFQRNTMAQVSIELGYSEKQVFNLRNKIMDDLLISLKGLLQM